MAADPLTPYGNRPMVTPIVNAVNYEYSSFEVLRKITDGEIDGYTYHRDDNPTVRAVEKKIAAMEGSEDCIVCTSGMAACTMVNKTLFFFPCLLVLVLLVVADVGVAGFLGHSRREWLYWVWFVGVVAMGIFAAAIVAIALLLPVLKMSESL